MRAIYLIGFMGAGKTTVGKALSKALQLTFYDTDVYISEQQKRPIPAIFTEQGEEAFRQMETKALKDLPKENVIIATGGGVVTREENLLLMRKSGIVIHLYCSLEEIKARIGKDESRPLARQLGQLFARRENLYQGDFTVDVTRLTVGEAVTTICAVKLSNISDRNELRK